MKKINKAKRFLEVLLKDGSFPSVEVLKLSQDEGISESILRAAKKELGIMANRNGGQHGKWLWNLPAKEDKPEIKGSKAFESIEDAETKLSINEIVERARKALEEGNNQ